MIRYEELSNIAKQAWDTYQAYQAAPAIFKNISHEIESLHIMISREKDILEYKTLQPQEQEELRKILQASDSILRDLDNLLIKYQSLGGEESVSSFAARDKLRSEEIPELRARLLLNTMLFNTFITKCAMDEIKDLITNDTVRTKLESTGALPATFDGLSLIRAAAAGDSDRVGAQLKVLLAYRDHVVTALHAAADHGNIDVVRLLLEHGASIEATESSNGGTALIIAAGAGHVDVVRLLLEKGANIEATTSTTGATALHTGAWHGHTGVVKLLLEKGANIEATTSGRYGGTALLSATYGGHVDVVRLLLEHGANIEATRLKGGGTALITAADAGHPDVVELLLQKGANIEATISGRYGGTALHGAAHGGHADVVRLLLDKGASVDARTYGSTALILAAKHAHMEIMSLLLEKGACPRLADITGDTALHFILQNAGDSWKQYIPTISLLLESGANILHRNNRGESPLDLAETHGLLDVKQLVLKHINTHDFT